MGEKVENKYRTLSSTDRELIIGCHTFPKAVVDSIYERFADKDEETILAEQSAMRHRYEEEVRVMMRFAATEVLAAMRAEPDSAEMLQYLGVEIAQEAA